MPPCQTADKLGGGEYFGRAFVAKKILQGGRQDKSYVLTIYRAAEGRYSSWNRLGWPLSSHHGTTLQVTTLTMTTLYEFKEEQFSQMAKFRDGYSDPIGLAAKTVTLMAD